MAKLKLAEIKVDSRFRKKFVEIEALASSIEKYGLLHPIVVDENNKLIAGERRLRAHLLLNKKDPVKYDKIEVKQRSDLSKIEKKEIELEENIQRDNFTWQEEVDAKAELHKVKQKIHGEAVKGHASDGWGMRDTAAALGEAVGTVSMDIQLARGIKAFPELKKEKSKTTAYKKMKQLQTRALEQELARRMKDKGVFDLPNIINGNCIEVMSAMAQDSVDLILTDPPYGIDVDKSQIFGRHQATQTGFEDGDFETFDLLDKAIAQMYRVLRPDRHMYMFCAIDKIATLVHLLEKHGFWVHKMPIIWDKGSGSYPSQGTTFVHSYEPFLHCMKGKRKLNGNPRDVYPIKRVPSNRKVHPTEKPTELLRDLINLSSMAGETVLDPFAGSGSTLQAAKETSRQAIGIELDQVHYATICNRLGGNDEDVSDVSE